MSTGRGLWALLLIPALLMAACAGGSPGGDAANGPALTVYSGRSEKLIGPLIHRFSERSGIDVRIRYGSTSELTATLLEEGGQTPAALFISQDAAALGALSEAALLRPAPADLTAKLPSRFRSPAGDWVGLSGRARVVVYNTDRVKPEELPRRLAETTDSRFHSRFGVAPANASFQAHMAAYSALNGEAALGELLRGMAANAPRIYSKNSPIVEAVIAGEIDWGLVNHYYLMRALKEDPDAPARNFVMPHSDGSAFVNISGAALLKATEAAAELLRFLLSDEAQRYFSDETFEYPLVEGLGAAAAPHTDDLQEKELDFAAIAEALDPALTLIHESGLTRFR